MADWAAHGVADDVRPFAPRLEAATLVVVGGADRLTPAADGGMARRRTWRHGSLMRVSGAGHFPHLERPDTVLPALRRALA